MTTLTMTKEVLQEETRVQEENLALYESASAHIIEETEYVKKIRTTLEKIRYQIFKDDIGHKNTNHKLDAKHSCHTAEDGPESQVEASRSSFDLMMEKMRGKDLQLLEMNKENEVLKIKLEASREAGAAALRNVAQKLFDSYQKRSDELRKKHEDDKKLLQVSNLEKGQKFKQHVESLKQVTERLEGKHSQITELENLVQRMEEEKKLLLERKASLQMKLEQLRLNSKNAKSCKDLQTEISTLQRQISYLQFVIHSQHQNLRSVIQEMEGLKNDVQEQDKRIETLKEKVNVLEAQNKDLKSKIELWSDNSKLKVSKGVSTSEFMVEDTSPYLMLIRLRK
ncbi:coiled-coil domain-containing protein 68 [Phascolarctos cinereus]|uniref:Coiled-coil domain-containing protein 68 n=1 Tax=Phascolarctos cinereus TaxID=38626 RepID=A0A6P5KXR9_PHACI|nr:coiled-coil domain-containing protein 68 [Phascolarctos cinereus]XP_020850155.1 coiled-coil domain-containing protein 68 [Phascolarctos cinereus]XP_020850166.1 coiled-coil domain-containing protein 68 [Phascolarctos cinereus]XP_020850175.1 coiled-coil domain-containing protein 68 [Phascolarctos cinereus]